MTDDPDDLAAMTTNAAYKMRGLAIGLSDAVSKDDLEGVLNISRKIMFGYASLMLLTSRTVGAVVARTRRTGPSAVPREKQECIPRCDWYGWDGEGAKCPAYATSIVNSRSLCDEHAKIVSANDGGEITPLLQESKRK